MNMFSGLAGGLLVLTALGTPDDATTSTPALLSCARSVLEDHGEIVIQQDMQPDRLLTWPHQVDREELARLALMPDTDQAEWLNGMYQIQITLVPDEAGAPQFDVDARILGRQRTSLPVLRPSPWQRLESSGALEQELNTQLATCSDPADQ